MIYLQAGGAKGSKEADASDESDGSDGSDGSDESDGEDRSDKSDESDEESGSGGEEGKNDGEGAEDVDAEGEPEADEDVHMTNSVEEDADATLQNPPTTNDDDDDDQDAAMDVDEAVSARDRGGKKAKAREMGDVSVSPKGQGKRKGEGKQKQPEKEEGEGKGKGKAKAKEKADSKPLTKAAAKAAEEGAEYEEEKKPKRTAEEIAAAKAAAAETILKKVSEIDVAADFDEESSHQPQAGEAFLGYGFGYLRSGWKGAMFRAVNARAVDKKEGTEEMLSRWLVRAPDYLDENTAVPVLIPGKYVDQTCLRKIYNSASQLEVLKISGEDEPDYKMMVLGGNHRREVFIPYLEKLKGGSETSTKLEGQLLKKLQGAKGIDVTQGVNEELRKARERKAQAEKLIERGEMWVFKVYDYGEWTGSESEKRN